MEVKQKRILVLSDGPVPAPEHKKVEGGGLRAWGLANGIKQNNVNLHVDIAYNETYRDEHKFTSNLNDIGILTWTEDKVPELLKSYDTIIVSYCMGGLSVKVVDSIATNQQLVLDCYVPIYVEVSARQSKNIESEYHAFSIDVQRWAHVLRRGDLFLCASDAQKKFYEGVLSGLGRLNPVTYNDDPIQVVPYGIYRDEVVQTEHPIQKRIGKDHAKFKKLLWFGGIYPWFDLEDLIKATQIINKSLPTKLVIVGAKNPFNGHPDFTKKYEDLVSYIKLNKLEDMVIIEDWVSFDTRANWYLDADAVVVINKEGPENNLAWRTRLVDFTWANLPIITNGGDPVSNTLSNADAITIMDTLTPDSMASSIITLLSDEKRIIEVKKNLNKVKELFYWDNATKVLTSEIEKQTKPSDISGFGVYDVVVEGAGINGKIKKLARKIKKVPGYAKKYGLKNTATTIASTVERKLLQKIQPLKQGEPRVVVVSHQLDMSGAPFIIMDVAMSLRKSYPEMPVDFYTYNPTHPENIVALNKAGIRPKILFDREAVMEFNSGDVVVFNTSAQSNQLKSAVFTGLQSGKIKKLFWYVHEDEPELIFDKNYTAHIKRLMDSDHIEIITAAVKTRDNYRQHFGNTKNINIQTQRIITDKKYHRQLSEKDFDDKISFVLPGTVSDGRKGQLPIFYAFIDFYYNDYVKDTSAYRDFELVYVGLSDDFLSRQLEKHAQKALGDKFITYGKVTHSECLDIVMKSNVTICYSLRECLPLFVYEGMTTGHPILRNDSSGLEEQLIDGKNGYLLESDDYQQVKQTIKRLLSREQTSNEKLASMSRESYKIAAAQEKNNYDKLILQIYSVFNDEK